MSDVSDAATSAVENKNEAVRYAVDAGQSRFTVQAFAEGLLSAFAHDPVIAIRDFTGEAECAPGTLEPARLSLTIKAGSLAVVDGVSDKDRPEVERVMREEVLETEKYPEIVFESTNVSASRLAEGRYRARLIGDIQLHGVTHSGFWIYAKVSVREETLRAEGEFSLQQTDYGIKPYSAAGGTVKVKNELKFSFDIAARKVNGQ